MGYFLSASSPPYPSGYGGNYELADFVDNTFDQLGTGVFCKVRSAYFTDNTFSGCNTGVLSLGIEVGAPTQVQYNTLTVPAGVGGIGIEVGANTGCTYNTISGSPRQAGDVQTGIYCDYAAASNFSVSANHLSGLDEGLRALTNDKLGGTMTIERNRFTDNATGIAFYPYYTTNPALQPVYAHITCNSFTDNGTVSNPVGIWIKNRATIDGGLGGATGNGNEFQQAQWGVAGVTKKTVRNDNNSALLYTRYGYTTYPTQTYSEYVISATTTNVSSTAVAGAYNACNGGVGVNNRQAATRSSNPGELPSGAHQVEAGTYLPQPAYPNPATATLHVPYALPEGVITAELIVRDALGRQVARQVVRETHGEVALAVAGWATGLYQVTLATNGQVLGNQRVAISHE